LALMREAQVIAALYRCQGCQVWWVSQAEGVPETHLVFRLADAHPELFLWENYRGGRPDTAQAAVCPECGERVTAPNFSLHQNGTA
jgi:hypothetical protein